MCVCARVRGCSFHDVAASIVRFEVEKRRVQLQEKPTGGCSYGGNEKSRRRGAVSCGGKDDC